ncbi:MAG: choice-of-anchor L domain-containing protein [Chryseobacterium sp.]
MLNYRLKNYFFFLVFLLVSGSAFSQYTSRKNGKVKLTSESMKAGAFIDVNVASYTQSSYTPQQLVQQVLINGQSTCATPNVSNVTVSPNHPVTDNDRFWGYFHKGTTNFPFEDGIVLTTGYARQAGNAAIANNLAGTISSNGDADLAAATNTNINNQRDAVALEFDFVPNSNQVKFNYIFASEEYSLGYPCSYSDAFALLIKPVAGGPYTNVAILPGTAGPVSVTNIRPATQFDGSTLSCGALNPTYFAGYNTSSIETNYNGRVVPLTAIADVTPGVAYHFKMVLSDYNDQTLDSAVFLEGGSFDIGIKIVDANGVVLPDTVNMCDNTPQVLTAQLTVTPGMTFQWYKDGVAINGATNVSYTATSPGAYEVKVAVPGNQCPASAVITIVGGTTPPAQNATLKLCTTPSVSAFNLNDAIPMITTSTTAVVHYYVNQADAVEQNSNYLSTAAASNYSGTDGQMLYVVVSNGAFCSKMVT